MSRDRLLATLQLASALLLLLGWYWADRARTTDQGVIALLGSVWFLGAASAALAWKIAGKRRFLSAVEFVLNSIGLVCVGILVWSSHKTLY